MTFARLRLPAPSRPSRLLAERRHHLLGEEARRLPRVPPEELDREERAAEAHVPLDHAFGRAPDPVLLEPGAHVPAVDLLRLLELRARRLVVLRDHHHALLRHLERLGVAPYLFAAAPQRLHLLAEPRLE